MKAGQFFGLLNPLFLFFLLSAPGCTNSRTALSPGASSTTFPSLQRFPYAQVSMGVQVKLIVYAPDEESALTACRAAYARIAEINRIASDYINDSELMRLCRRAGQGPVKVSDDMMVLLDRSLHIS